MVKKHRQYENDYPSVTQILSVLRKIGLEMWFKFNTAKFCNAESKRGREAGTDTHNVIQDFIDTGSAKIETEYPSEVTTALKSFQLFKKDNPNTKLHKAEIALTSEKYKYNGTIDCIGEVDGVPFVVDWKTGKVKDKDTPVIYDEYKYQVASYVYLYNEINGTNIQNAIIVSIAKDKECYATYIMGQKEIEDCFNEVFLPALQIINYQNKVKKEKKK